jgi:hypothetical protein
MFGRNRLMKQVDDLARLLGADTVEYEAAQKAANDVMKAARGANVQQLNDAEIRLASLVPDLKLGRAALVAITCGALVERGASMEPLAVPALTRFSEAVRDGLPFLEACLAEAAANPPRHEKESGAESDEEESEENDAEEAIAHFAGQVSERMPDSAQAFSSMEWLSTAALAMLSRSKVLRAQLKADTPLVQAIGRWDELGLPLPCFHEMLLILDDEQIVVLHPELARGYIIRIAGIGNNFQLHTLLADTLIGDTAQGWLPGERPSQQVVALAKDALITDPDKLPTAHGAFNLWNWTGLGATGSLPGGDEGQATGSAHWIWNEGVPADIVPFQGTRVILIGPPPYARAWNSGRFFPAMVGELEVLRQLSAEEARDWLDRLASAPKPEASERYISADDIEDVEDVEF